MTAHKWERCGFCGPMVVCGKCGNNCCNGGTNDGCPDKCASAYAMQKNGPPSDFDETCPPLPPNTVLRKSPARPTSPEGTNDGK